MPELAVRPCLQPGCGEYAVTNGRCAEHASKNERLRGTTKERGYAGGWPALRARKLAADPLCQIQTHCGKGIGQDDPVAATEVDHIIPISERPDLRLAWSNLQSACKPCNAAKGGRYQN